MSIPKIMYPIDNKWIILNKNHNNEANGIFSSNRAISMQLIYEFTVLSNMLPKSLSYMLFNTIPYLLPIRLSKCYLIVI